MNTGPSIYENWIAAESKDVPWRGAFEYPLFTDAWIVGDLSCRPYQLLNTVFLPRGRDASAQTVSAALVLQLEYYLSHELPSWEKTDVTHYHGSGMGDEVAALVSLCMGIRLKSGGETRRFDPGGDPRGRPVAYRTYENPVFLRSMGHPPVLPGALGIHRLQDATLFTQFNHLCPQDAVALVRASRLYQDAIWIAESQPKLAWVMLVSAVEAAAGHWKTSTESPEERLRTSKPDLEKLLEAEGGRELVSKVAPLIADYMGSTRKFIDFLLDFLPDPPSKRPPEHAQHPWDKKSMKKSLATIYRWRSRALHGGSPFPFPMCEPPLAELEEKPLGLATGARGAVWRAKDTPMLLHTFEHIVRGALLNWWESML